MEKFSNYAHESESEPDEVDHPVGSIQTEPPQAIKASPEEHMALCGVN